jgi:acetolactate synthase-1/2/3 large subunit
MTAASISLYEQPPAEPQTVLDVFLKYLKAERVRVIFGIPGGLLYPFFEAIERDDELRLIVSKHEEGAAFMADGYARVGRCLSVVASTGGPGSTNLLTGVAVSFADGVPMLVLTGQAASHAFGKGAAQETTREDIDIVAMFRPVTKYSAMVTAADNLARHLRRALRLALTGRPGPVHLNVPVDLWNQPLDEGWFNPSTYRPHTRTFDRRAVQDATDVLLDASRPVFLAGSGVDVAGAADHLRSLAELLPAMVATTPRAKGVFPEDHPLSLGVFGFAGHRAAKDTILGPDVDVLFSVGASLNETTTMNWHRDLMPSRALVQLDIDADRVGRNYPVSVPLIGDAQSILVELVYHVHRRIREQSSPRSLWKMEERDGRGDDWYDELEARQSDRLPMTPQRWRAELSDLLPRDAIVFSDIGGHMLFNIHDLRIGKDQRFILNLGFGSMGHGTVAPIGAALSGTSSPIVTIVGDACFSMNGMELLTAAEYDVPVLWIVEQNQMHGITYHGSMMLSDDGRPLESIRYRRPVDVVAIARAMGVEACTVETPDQFTAAVRQALARRRPCLIEVRVDGSIPPPVGGRVKAIAGFSRG